MTKRDLIIEVVESLDNDDLIYLHQNYLDNVSGWDDRIYDVDSFDEVMEGNSPEWIAHRIFYGDYNPTAPYFKFNGYGNIKSIFEYELSEYIDIDEIADYIIENENALYNDEIQNILDDTMEENEDDN